MNVATLRSFAIEDKAGFVALAETVSSLIALIQGDHIVYINPAGLHLLGRRKDDLVGRNFWDVVHPDDREKARTRGRARLSGSPQPRRLVERLQHADGRAIWMDYAVDLFAVDGVPTTLVTGYDITDRVAAETALRKSEERFRALFTHAPVMMCLLDGRGRFVEISEAWLERFGYTRDELVGRPLDTCLTEESAARLAAAGPAVRELTLEGRMKAGCGVSFLLTRVPEPGGCCEEAGGSTCVAADVTEQRRAQERLAEAQRIGHIGSWEWDVPGDRITWSDEMFRIFGLTPQSFVPTLAGYLDHLPPEDRPVATRTVEAAMRDHRPYIFEHHVVLPDGRRRLICGRGEVFTDCQGRVVRMAGTAQDITEARLAETALRESEERYRVLVEAAPEAIVVGDAETGRFVDVNEPAVRLFGLPRETLLTLRPTDCSPRLQADGRTSEEAAAEYIARALAGESFEFEWTHEHASGRPIPCRIHITRLPATGRRLVRATIVDITEQKQMREKIRHADKMAVLGVLAAGVAHEIGNPLLALSMAVESLERRQADEYGAKKLRVIQDHVSRISRIVRQMSDLARPQASVRGSCDLNAVVRRAMEVVRYDTRCRDIDVEVRAAETLPSVQAVEDELVQVCLNLALNALDALSACASDRPRRLVVATRAAGAAVRVSFEDSGPGVPAEIRDRLFQPFVTTKEPGRGTGLGLSICARILREHGGSLRHEDVPGGGARFVFELPARETTCFAS